MKKKGERIVVAGIDLAGIPERRAGFALLSVSVSESVSVSVSVSVSESELRVLTKVLHTDKEIVSETLKAKPKIVAVDAPLGLPKGRCCLSYECDCEKYGSIRVCEKQLMKMDIRVFPCGFGGM